MSSKVIGCRFGEMFIYTGHLMYALYAIRNMFVSRLMPVVFRLDSVKASIRPKLI